MSLSLPRVWRVFGDDSGNSSDPYGQPAYKVKGGIAMCETFRRSIAFIRSQMKVAFRSAKIAILALAGVAALQVVVGCAGTGESSSFAAASTPLTTYPNQVFATSKPGQLGLYIEGQDWYLLVDMPGFENVEEKFSAPSQFLFMRSNASGATASVFAERISEANNAESCRRHYASSVQQARDETAKVLGEKGTVGEVTEMDVQGKLLRVFEFRAQGFGPRKSIFWYPYYDGFCFGFHFNVSDAAAEKDVLKVFDSVKYVQHMPSGVDIDRLFYFSHLRIRLSVPIDWKYAYRSPPPGPVGGIELQSTKGQTFSFLVIPFGKTRSAAHSDQPEGVAEEGRRSFAARGDTVSPLRSLCNSGTCVYYFDRTPPPGNKSYSQNIQYHRQAWAKIGDWVLGLSLLYRDDSKDAAERITAALSRAKVMDMQQ